MPATVTSFAPHTRLTALVACLCLGCGGSSGPPGGGGGEAGDGGPGDTDGVDGGGNPGADGGGSYPGAGDDLETATGCAGVFNPTQMVDYHLSMAEGDWSAVKSDSTNSVYVPAELTCGDQPGITVGVRRKRSGTLDKPGLKVDINRYVDGQSYHGLKKLSLENGVSEGSGSGEVRAVMQEYLAWRLFVLSGAMSGRAAFARLFVNGELLGVYVQVEQVDKRFLKIRLGNDSGWLWKFSGSDRDGLKTNEGTDDPYDDYFCFFEKNGCATPSAEDLAADLPEKLDIPQVLAVGGVNALMANTDAPILKLNNYIYYDWTGPRLYLPWDLDSAMNDSYDVFTGSVPGGTTRFTDALFPAWEDDYDAYLTGLLDGPLSLQAISGEIDQALSVAGGALDADPHLAGDAESAAASLDAFWVDRHAQVSDQLAAH